MAGPVAGGIEPALDLLFVKTHPLIGHLLMKPFHFMADQVGDEQLSARLKNAIQLRQCLLRMSCMVQHHIEDYAIGSCIGNRQMGQFTQAQLNIFELFTLDALPGFIEHRRGLVNADNMPRGK